MVSSAAGRGFPTVTTIYICRGTGRMEYPTDEESDHSPAGLTDHLDDQTKLAIQVYRQTWEEFYAWERSYCINELKSLHSPVTVTQESQEHINFATEGGDLQEFELEPGPDSFTIQEFDEDEESTVYHTLTPEVISAGVMKGLPQYTICTPTSRNHALEDHNVNTNDVLQFIPFADDPKFPLERYTILYGQLAWQTDFFDPDLEIIQLETALRLHYDHDLSFSQIDRLKVVPELRSNPTSGLFWDTAQRDIPWWTGILSEDRNTTRRISRNLFLSSPPDAPDLFEDVNQNTQHFCPKLACLRLHCGTHTTAYGGLDRPKPQITSLQMQEACITPCGNGCIYHLSEAEDVQMFGYQAEDNSITVRSIIRVLPDTSPCDLSAICRIPCRDVFSIRCQMFDDETIERNQYRDPSTSIRGHHFIDGPRGDPLSNPNFVPVPPCHHPGPCDQYSSCACYNEQQHCQRACRCESRCKIRWKGCKCGSKRDKGRRHPCKDFSKCPCRGSGRECDPERCISCDARRVLGKTNGRCTNMAMQRAKYPTLVIRKGAFGFGAFALKTIKEFTPIGEYVAEIIPELKSDEVDILHNYTGLNYIFGLNSFEGLDALRMGNETRFLNDPRNLNAEPNCEALVYSVDGDHRIVLHTTRRIKPEEELYLEYGEGYWNSGQNPLNIEQPSLLLTSDSEAS